MLNWISGYGVLMSGSRVKLDKEFASEITEGRKVLESFFNAQKMEIQYSNGIIDGMYFPCEVDDAKRKIVIFFPGMGESYERIGIFEYVDECFIHRYKEANFDVILWNYPHVSRSTGSPTIENVMEASEKILNFALEKTQQNRILLHGHSMGGGISVYFASQRDNNNNLKYPYLNICNDRSFSSLKKATSAIVNNTPFIGTFLPGSFCGYFVSNLCSWNLDSFNNWNLPDFQGYRWVIHHVNDEIVLDISSLASSLKESQDDTTIIELDPSNKYIRNGQEIDFGELYENVCHERPLTTAEWEEQLKQLNKAIQ